PRINRSIPHGGKIFASKNYLITPEHGELFVSRTIWYTNCSSPNDEEGPRRGSDGDPVVGAPRGGRADEDQPDAHPHEPPPAQEQKSMDRPDTGTDSRLLAQSVSQSDHAFRSRREHGALACHGQRGGEKIERERARPQSPIQRRRPRDPSVAVRSRPAQGGTGDDRGKSSERSNR